MKFFLVLVGFLGYASFFASGTITLPLDDIVALNSASEAAATDESDSTGVTLTTVANDFFQKLEGPTTGLSPSGFRLWVEGTLTALVLAYLHIAAEENQSLILSGYGGNGATAFPVAKDRCRRKEKVTIVLLPSADGSRGTNGIIKATQHKPYDRMEKDLRDWNTNRPTKINIITILDETDISNDGDKNIFKEAEIERQNLAPFFKAKADALKDATDLSKLESTKPEDNANYILKAAELSAVAKTYFNDDGAPVGDLAAAIERLVTEKLNKLKLMKFKYCFEGHSRQGFVAKRGTAVSYPTIDFLAEIKLAGVVIASLDYPLGSTDTGLPDDHRYVPNTMAIIFLRKSLLAKNTRAVNNLQINDYQLQGVTIVQLDWNTVVKHLLAAVAAKKLIYSATPRELVQTTSTNWGTSCDYKTLAPMDKVLSRNVWDDFVF